MKNHWIEKARLHDIAYGIDEKIGEAYKNGGTLGDVFFNMTEEELEFMMNLKLSDGAMCQRGYEFTITGVNSYMEPPYDWSRIHDDCSDWG